MIQIGYKMGILNSKPTAVYNSTYFDSITYSWYQNFELKEEGISTNEPISLELYSNKIILRKDDGSVYLKFTKTSGEYGSKSGYVLRNSQSDVALEWGFTLMDGNVNLGLYRLTYSPKATPEVKSRISYFLLGGR